MKRTPKRQTPEIVSMQFPIVLMFAYCFRDVADYNSKEKQFRRAIESIYVN